MKQLCLPLDGFCCGPLFKPVVKRRTPKPNNGPQRVALVRSRIPRWAEPSQIRMFYAVSEQRRTVTGVEWSVDHIVPINHPLVCGVWSALCLEPSGRAAARQHPKVQQLVAGHVGTAGRTFY